VAGRQCRQDHELTRGGALRQRQERGQVASQEVRNWRRKGPSSQADFLDGPRHNSNNVLCTMKLYDSIFQEHWQRGMWILLPCVVKSVTRTEYGCKPLQSLEANKPVCFSIEVGRNEKFALFGQGFGLNPIMHFYILPIPLCHCERMICRYRGSARVTRLGMAETRRRLRDRWGRWLGDLTVTWWWKSWRLELPLISTRHTRPP
jgi:hypothetical protein